MQARIHRCSLSYHRIPLATTTTYYPTYLLTPPVCHSTECNGGHMVPTEGIGDIPLHPLSPYVLVSSAYHHILHTTTCSKMGLRIHEIPDISSGSRIHPGSTPVLPPNITVPRAPGEHVSRIPRLGGCGDTCLDLPPFCDEGNILRL